MTAPDTRSPLAAGQTALPSASVSWAGRHIISIADFSTEDLLHLLDLAAIIERRPHPDLLSGRLMATLFFESSTRTRLSFEAAMSKLGGQVIGVTDAVSSSARKGESIADTIRMVDQYANVIVLRHHHEGAARLAGDVSRVPVINGGDGANQHPTQTFLDLYTIAKLFPDRLQGAGAPLRITVAGDLRYGRTVHSLLTALTHFSVSLQMVPVAGLELPQHCVNEAALAGHPVTVLPDLEAAVAQSDVLYMTRLQQERFPDPLEFEHVKSAYRVDAAMLRSAASQLRILHPLPRVKEIAGDVDVTPHAAYIAQAGNGVPIRQALLALVLGRADELVG